MPPPLGLSEEVDQPSDKNDFDTTDFMMSTNSMRIVTKKQIKDACEMYDVPIVMGGIKKVHYIDAFKKVCHNVIIKKFNEEDVANSRISKMDKVLEESWCRKFPDYKTQYEKLMNEPFTISLRMYFLFKFVMRTYDIESEKKKVSQRMKQLQRNNSILNTIPPNPIT